MSVYIIMIIIVFISRALYKRSEKAANVSPYPNEKFEGSSDTLKESFRRSITRVCENKYVEIFLFFFFLSCSFIFLDVTFSISLLSQCSG